MLEFWPSFQGEDPLNQEPSSVDAREPSFTAMWCAWARNHHATMHSAPIHSDTRSVHLVPEPARQRILSEMEGFSPQAAEALTLAIAVRHRVLSDRLLLAQERGVRQLVILGAGLDTTGFDLPAKDHRWRVFEV